LNTPITPLFFRGRDFYIKRDDLISDFYPGNKYRKLYSLINTDSSKYKNIISYGGAQSNAMLAIAHLANKKNWKFTYYLKTLPIWLKEKPVGNFKMSLELNMNYVELPHDEYESKISSLKSDLNTLVISQGGADIIAKSGVEKLALEIIEWKEKENISNLYVVTPSGTGTTSLYLANALKNRAVVLTTPVVADEKYLKEQWKRLDNNIDFLPKILSTEKKYNFAKPYIEFLEIWKELKSIGVEFDLIYAPKMWLSLLENIPKNGKIIYIHSGGISGNETQILRYEKLKV